MLVSNCNRPKAMLNTKISRILGNRKRFVHGHSKSDRWSSTKAYKDT